MAQDLEKTTDKKPQELSKIDDAIFSALERGVWPQDVPRVLSKGNRRLYAKIRRRMRVMWRQDHVQYIVAERARAMATAGFISSLPALTRRAQRGRIDAIKYLGELSGIHNPKVQHEHSGDINLTFTMPRPALPQGQQTDEPVVDAEVVEDV